jgi:RHS repeat-associated protein
MNNNTSGGTLLSDFGSMTYDSVGNRMAVAAAIPASPALAGATSYAYDTKNELLQENSARNGGYVNNFGYDAAENPVSFKGTANTFNTDNQNTAFAFDGNGNPTTYKGTALGFDPENRLTSYGTAMTVGYNGDDLRAWKSSAAGKTYFVYDGDSPVLELDSNGNVTAFNVWGMIGLLSRRTGTTSVYNTFDPQGSVVQRLDGNQNILSTSAYDAWGNPLVPKQNDPFGYNAQWRYYTDNETGLILLTHRYYDPTQGRFLTRDPIGYEGGVNLYGYVKSNPITYYDREGYWSCKNPTPGKFFQNCPIVDRVVHWWWCYGCKSSCVQHCNKQYNLENGNMWDKCMKECEIEWRKCIVKEYKFKIDL